ncbi:MAG TPA: hypothetical protein VMV10_12195 [Pirellulales bacterium]|nr:hypothetical protein [Pirellulales bacterium]
MLRTKPFVLAHLALWAGATALHGEEPASETPNAIPHTRPAIKQALEALKERQPRLPLPPLTDAERASGGRPSVNNGRMAAYYLPASWRPARAPRGSSKSDSAIDYALATECFWIVSRANNCHY